jgi:hypothetical protein
METMMKKNMKIKMLPIDFLYNGKQNVCACSVLSVCL